MPQSRVTIINEVFENMSAMKRGMYSHFQTIMKDCPVSRTQLELLFTIKHLQPISFKHLAKQLYLTPGAVSQLADSLLQDGFITREIDPNDRRTQSLSLSEKGEGVLTDIEKRQKKIMEQVMQDLTTEELAAWANVQKKLIAHFQNEVKPNEETK
jgi:DNA-binding MarR family transcriptional regulator